MMTFRFERVPYGNTQARPFLENAVRRTPSPDKTLDETLAGGDVYLVSGDEPVGATYIEYTDIGYGQMMNIVLLGGEKIHEWRADYAKFIRELMGQKNVRYLMVVGRSGWDSIFRELKPIGTVYLADALA